MSKIKYVLSALTALLLFLAPLHSQTHTMLPRFPDIVIEKGLAQNFAVSECEANAFITGDRADTSLSFRLDNVSDKTQPAALKFRVLYPINPNLVKILINKTETPYVCSNPRSTITLEAGQSVLIKISAEVSINYSKNAVRNALQRDIDEKNRKRSRSNTFLSELSRFFRSESFGRRFMVGNLVSKWGIFPVDFKNVKIKVVAPREFVIVSTQDKLWHKSSSAKKTTFTTTALDGFAGTVFVPEADKDEFIKTQKLLSSERFMH